MAFAEPMKNASMTKRIIRVAVNVFAISCALAVLLSLTTIMVVGGPDALGGFLFEGAIPILDRR